MKKIISLSLIIALILLTGCSKSPAENSKNNNTVNSTENFAQNFQKLDIGTYTIVESLGEMYYGYYSFKQNDFLEDKPALMNTQTKKSTDINVPEQIASCPYVGSGSKVTLQDRYFYEWINYEEKPTTNKTLDVSLVRIDGKNGNMQVVDVLKSRTPLIYMCKINDTKFLSYSNEQNDSGTISNAWIYDINNGNKKIIYEKYVNTEGCKNSNGILIENFFVKNGELYGIGRKNINGEYKFFLYNYSIDGKLVSESELLGLTDIIHQDQIVEISAAGDYIAFRTYKHMTPHICKITSDGVQLIKKDAQYAVTNDKIYFIESNVDPNTDKPTGRKPPMYVIDVKSDTITKYNFDIPMKNPYFVNIISLDNNDVVITYCEEKFDSMNLTQFVLKHP